MHRHPQKRNSDHVHRPLRSRRVLVDVQYRLSRDEVRHAFVYYVTHFAPETYLKTTPTIEPLSRILVTMLMMNGHEATETVHPTPGEVEAGADILAWAERCTVRLWGSTRVVERE